MKKYSYRVNRRNYEVLYNMFIKQIIAAVFIVLTLIICNISKNPILKSISDEFKTFNKPVYFGEYKINHERKLPPKHQNSIFTMNETTLPSPENCSLNEIIISTPLKRPVENGEISCFYGYRVHPVTGNNDFHAGIDIAVPLNSDITAVLNGKIKETGENRIYGKYIIMSHDGGLETVYCHCNDIFVKEGMNIRRGERLGKSGNTGLSTGPHLHFEVKYKGINYNPEYLL